MSTEAYVFDAIRTPRGRGKSDGSLHTTKPVDLVVGLMHETLSRHGDLDPNAIDDVVLGCVTPIGDEGADIARTAALQAGLPDTVAGVQVNRFCASGLGVPIETVAAPGHPPAVLAEQSQDATLLVVGTRGRGGFASLVLGSVSQAVAHQGRHPPVIVHSTSSEAPIETAS